MLPISKSILPHNIKFQNMIKLHVLPSPESGLHTNSDFKNIIRGTGYDFGDIHSLLLRKYNSYQ